MGAPLGSSVCLVKGRDLYHIEQTKDPEAHVSRFASLLPFEVELVHVIQTDDAEDVKNRLHQRFASKRVRQAWFALDEADVAWIVRCSGKWQTGTVPPDPPAERAVSRRDRRKQERERRILQAAASVFAQKGYHQATIREIAQQANVADGTIYNYFANKRALLVSMTGHIIADSVGSDLVEFVAKDDRSYLTAILKSRLRFQQQNADFVHALMSEVWSDTGFRDRYLSQVLAPLLHLMESYLQARIEAGTVRPVDTGIAVRAMAGSFLIFLLLSQPGHGGLDFDIPLDQLVDELVDFFLLGLQA